MVSLIGISVPLVLMTVVTGCEFCQQSCTDATLQIDALRGTGNTI
jgi:hypothetical protein